MTSRHLFFKAMREDLRHKLWMIALSVLGNFLLLPIPWLIQQGNLNIAGAIVAVDDSKHFVTRAMEFGEGWMLGAGGFIAIAGALIVGMFGFRYVFHKNMIDTYHSIPVRRRTLYGVCWLNGFLIWLVPFFVCFGFTLALVSSYLQKLPGGGEQIPVLLKELAVTFVLLLIAFLLTYHLVLVAVMLSGNILNTIVSALILGLGAVIVYALGLGFFELYMSTFYGANTQAQAEVAVYASPLISAGYMLYLKADNLGSGSAWLWKPLAVNAAMAALLGAGSWLLYSRRESELAEQGIRNKVFGTAFRILVTVAAGMTGWQIFHVLVSANDKMLFWGTFGVLLAGILAFGVMNIILGMDFKAFFAHKGQLVISLAATLAVCFCFLGDWIGYDTYLPRKEDIAEIAVVDTDLMNRVWIHYGMSDDDYLFENIHITDIDAAYRFLKTVTERESGAEDRAASMEEPARRWQRIETKVTLRSGRSYYRYYRVSDADLDLVWPLFSDPSYLEAAFLATDEVAGDFDMVSLERNNRHVEQRMSPEEIAALLQAYNQDVSENPEATLLARGIYLVDIELSRFQGYVYESEADLPKVSRLSLDIYDSMEHTVAAMEQLGLGEWVTKTPAGEISEIVLPLSGSFERYETVEDVIDKAREYYGVYAEGGSADTDAALYPELAYGEMVSERSIVGGDLYLSITDPTEIAELMQYLSYGRPLTSNVFRVNYLSVKGIQEGDIYSYYIHMGDLPEKYIQRFGQLYDSAKVQAGIPEAD